MTNFISFFNLEAEQAELSPEELQETIDWKKAIYEHGQNLVFRGTQGQCGKHEAHVPHAMTWYRGERERYCRFCPGVVGDVDGYSVAIEKEFSDGYVEMLKVSVKLYPDNGEILPLVITDEMRLLNMEDRINDLSPRLLRQKIDEKIAQLRSAEGMNVSFHGTFCTCNKQHPHMPHTISGYSTVRYGWLENFCPGIMGEYAGYILSNGKPASSHGSAEMYGYLKAIMRLREHRR